MMAMRTSRVAVVSQLQYPCPVYDITTATRASVRQPAFGQFTSPSLNCYGCFWYLTASKESVLWLSPRILPLSYPMTNPDPSPV